MNKPRRIVLVLLVGVLLLPARTVVEAQNATKPAGQQTVAFVDVSVIPMDRERVLKNQTVLVRDGRIAEIGDAAKVKVPAGAERVDGRGKYLAPGLIDMHTHLLADDVYPDSLAADELAVMLANGVTTIRLMIGTPDHLRLRERISKGELLAPRLYVASPELTGRAAGNGVFNGFTVRTPEEARRAVRDSKAAGYDFIKLTNQITRPVFDAVHESAKELGIRVVGHVDTQVGLARALEVRQQIEHLDSYMEAVLKDDSPIKVSVSDAGVWRKPNWESLDYVDERKLAEVAKATAKAGIYTCPTLTFFQLTFAVEQSEAEIRARPDYRFFPVKMNESRHAAHKRFWTAPPSAERRARYIRYRQQLVKGIYDAGGKIMTGSDTPEMFLLYGFSLHREMKLLVDAGLSPYAALEAATRNPAEFLNAISRIGTIERGKRADLVLFDANPLDDIRNTERRAGVMVGGRWLAEAELKALLDRIAPRLQAATATQ